MRSAHYRADIDGLRFIAIVPVVLFHAGISGFRGGFVGVDIFFVISGYLITGIILGELDQGKFSIVRFYERRIRRIFPALFALLAFVYIVAPTALLPSELRTLPYEMIGALAFIANIVFWRQADYFSTSAEEKPLLHTWSLGVEEQFYIFVPLILWLLVRYFRRALLPMVLMALILSLALCIYFTPIKASASFYLLPFRAWELLVGSVLAIGLPQMRSVVLNEGLALLGLLGLLFAIFAYDEGTEFPGYAATLPVISAALIIQFADGSAVGRLLGSKPLVFIGLISYSLYLWHWPLIVFFRDWGLLESSSGRVVVVALSLVMAWFSWKFVETPFRKPLDWPRPRLFRWAAISSGVVTAAAVLLYLTDGWPSRFSPEDVAFDVARNDISPERKRCLISAGFRSFDDLCRLGVLEGGKEPDTLVWSDSHGVEIAAALAEAGLPVVQASYSACPPSLHFKSHNSPQCAEHNKRILDAVERKGSIRTVILTAYYVAHLTPEFWVGMRNTITRLKAADKRIIVLGPLPNFDRDVPSFLAAGHRETLKPHPVPPQFARYITDVKVISIMELLCPQGTCSLIVNNKPLLFDHSHLSITAARSIAPQIVRQIRETVITVHEPVETQ